MNIQIITIGDEILIGQIVDTNSAWMGQELNLNNFSVSEIKTVGDTHENIESALASSLAEVDVVLVTGGLGATKDDITKKVLAKHFGLEMVYHEATHERIKRLFKKFGRTTTEGHYHQSFMPEGSTIITNKMGTAPGMWIEQKGKIVVSMPGVPYEMKWLMKHEIIPRLRSIFKGEALVHRTIQTAGQGESHIATTIADFEENLPDNIKLAYLPSMGKVRLRLSAKGTSGESPERLERVLDLKQAELEVLIPDIVFGYGRDSLESVLGQILKKQGKTIATAESCTGGHLAHSITSIPGCSSYFMGSVIAYDNKVKMELLGVEEQSLKEHGAVSKATVEAMVVGACKLLGTDFAIATSGIAGPGGGTPEKPVGTIWIAVGNAAKRETLRLEIGKDRMTNIQYTTSRALNMMRNFLLA